MNLDMNKALVAAVEYKCDYENSNPEVGFGPAPDQIVDSVLEHAGLKNNRDVNHTLLEMTAAKFLR